MPINYLGLYIRFHDIAWGLPAEEKMEGVFAILSWCKKQSMVNATPFCKWLTAQGKSGIRLVLMGELPFLRERTNGEYTATSLIEDLFRAIDLDYLGDTTSNPLLIRIDKEDPEMVGFERPLDENDLEDYALILPRSDLVRSYLTISRADKPGSGSIGLCTTPNGGFSTGGAALYQELLSESFRWLINPFLFFERAFGVEGMPRFDTTTLFGRRIFYSHIDGDGLRNVSDVPGYVESGEVILKEIIQKYSLPISASLISAEVHPEYFGNSHIERLATAIFAEENVETGAHGFSHPLNWAKGITAFAIPGYSEEIDAETLKGSTELSESGYKQGAIITVPTDEWLYAETVGAATYLTKEFCPPEKPIAIVQWTGNCRPQARAIQMVDRADLLNINGGDGRLDRVNPTYTAVAPLTRTTSGERQTYTSNANDNIYTNSWKGPYYGQIYLLETFEQTEIPTLIDGVPRRVLPMNLYYHYYSGEKEASLWALRLIYEYVLKSPCIPIYTSHFCRIVKGFFSAKIDRLDDNGWRFAHYGACQTVRFDREVRWPDLERSKGVLGFQRWHDHLYVHLTEKGEATLYLTDTPPTQPYLIEASAPLTELSMEGRAIRFTTEALQDATYRFANLTPNTDYRITPRRLHRKRSPPIELTERTDAHGTLDFLIPIHGRATIEIHAMASAS